MVEQIVGQEKQHLEMILIGAPGSGKSEIAKQFQAQSQEWFAEKGLKPLVVLDGLPEALQEEAGIELAAFGNHFDAASIYFHGEVRRRRTARQEKSFIDTQNLINSIAHVNARLNGMAQLVATPDSQAAMQREFQMGTVLTNYLVDHFQVNFAWYAPLPEKIIVPGRDNGNFPASVDAVIRDMNTKLGLGVPVLVGSREDQVKRMVEDLDKFYMSEGT